MQKYSPQMYLNKIHSELLHKISTYLGYAEVHFSLKYLSKETKTNIVNNKKIEMRKSNVYIQLMKQKIYFMHKSIPNEQFYDMKEAIEQYYLLKNNIACINKKQDEKLKKLNSEVQVFIGLLKNSKCLNKPLHWF